MSKKKRKPLDSISNTSFSRKICRIPNESNSKIHKPITRSDEKTTDLVENYLDLIWNRRKTEKSIRSDEPELRGGEEEKTKESVRSARRDGSCEKRYRRREETLWWDGWAF